MLGGHYTSVRMVSSIGGHCKPKDGKHHRRHVRRALCKCKDGKQCWRHVRQALCEFKDGKRNWRHVRKALHKHKDGKQFWRHVGKALHEHKDGKQCFRNVGKALPKHKDGKNAVEVKLTWQFSRKHPVFPVSLVKPYFQTEEDKFSSRKKQHTTPEIVEVEDSPGPVKKILKAMKIRLNGKDQRQYLVRFKNQTADKDKLLEEGAIPDGNLNLRRSRASRRREFQPATQNQSTNTTAKYHKSMV
ncbi:hypothetical protein O181_026899 [Austropuccinia psidii MF-1]|uniref:Uncharacterized protein n=1 Tax=Austropuccinia psidii MF-1 TaxID=1389203 RepID=A0A9Q3CKV2_9BASI|nr:hypothetical protein [Austropuccinia psidii MF-1]